MDVIVTDKEGRFVSGLTAADFVVKEDGKAQDLAYFGVEIRPETAASHVVAAPPPTGLSPEVLPPPPPPMTARPRGRQIVIAVDDLHVAPTNLAAAREALKRFVDEQLSDDDEVALVTTSGTTGLTQELTRDRAVLRRAIERLSLIQERRVQWSDVPHLTEYQAELIDRGDPEALRVAVEEIRQENEDIDEGLARLQAAQRAHSMLVEIMSYSGQALRTLESVVRSLGPLPGRKVVVLASDGFLVGLGASDSRHFDLRRVVDAATRSGVVLYALDTRGLVSEVPGGDATFGGPPVLTAPGARESLQARSVEALRDPMIALSEDTGGFLVRNRNDLLAGLGDILRDTRHYYLLGYEPTNRKRDGKFRRIEVRLRNRPGLRVRTRAGYYVPDERKLARQAAVPAESPEARRDRELAQALASLLPLKGVGVRMVVDDVDLPPDGPRAVVKAHLDVSNVGFERKIDHYEAELDVAGAVFDPAGLRVADLPGETSRLKLPLENFQALRREGLLYEKAVPLSPGTYLVKLAVRAGGGGLLGSAAEWVEVQDRSAQPLSLSAVFLKADDGPPREGEPMNLQDMQVEKRFKQRQGLHYLVYVYRPEASAGEPADVIVQAQVWVGEKVVGAGPSHPVAFGGPGDPPPRQAERIALEPLGLGPYELRIVATDRRTGARAVRRLHFMVE